MNVRPEPPPVDRLTRAQYSGWACVWCGETLWHGAASAGISRGYSGTYALDNEVYECSPPCGKRPAT